MAEAVNFAELKRLVNIKVLKKLDPEVNAYISGVTCNEN